LTQRLRDLPLRRGGIVLAWLVVLGVSGFAGYAVTSRLVPDESDELLRNFPVIEKLDLYRNAESIEFVKQLEQKIGSFDARSTNKP
jgi:hypothetical protein